MRNVKGLSRRLMGVAAATSVTLQGACPGDPCIRITWDACLKCPFLGPTLHTHKKIIKNKKHKTIMG